MVHHQIQDMMKPTWLLQLPNFLNCEPGSDVVDGTASEAFTSSIAIHSQFLNRSRRIDERKMKKLTSHSMIVHLAEKNEVPPPAGKAIRKYKNAQKFRSKSELEASSTNLRKVK